MTHRTAVARSSRFGVAKPAILCKCIAHLVETGYPEVCTTEEEEQDYPEEPGVELTVAVQGGAQQSGEGFAEQDALSANHATEEGVGDGQSLDPAV